ncbi:glycosyltransferase family 4 protein, partial [uncultured Corynebacterium sp.]|uniref:glycosyltransferase family 4 protein n=1 Tax=uncultured Corynebacterium sp. TaxID=159447 RepID=UPI00345C1F1C
MRVAVVAESFLPQVNGVVNSVLRILDHLRRTGHEAVVIAPGVTRRERRAGADAVTRYRGFPVVRVPALYLPRIESLPIGVPCPAVLRVLRRFRPDVVHLASPFVLGAGGAAAAGVLRVPTVAVYQTDIPGYVDQYDLGFIIPALRAGAWQVVRGIHNRAAVTLAPSSATAAMLADHGVRRVSRWARGVDSDLFNPARRSDDLRRRWDPSGARRIVGYVGRLASEKNVQRLAALADDPGTRLVVVGDGPERPRLEALLPDAVFTGGLLGTDLAEAYASLDVFVHTGEFETFCQGLQEALACGVPSVAPAAGGPLDLVVPGVNGELLDVASFERDLPAAVDRLGGPGHDRVADAARRSVLHRTWPTLCGELVDVYREV